MILPRLPHRLITRDIRLLSHPLQFSYKSPVCYTSTRNMATVKDTIPHIVRTAEDPRQKGIWSANLSRIEQVNPKIRLLRLSLPRDGVCVPSSSAYIGHSCVEYLTVSHLFGTSCLPISLLEWTASWQGIMDCCP